MEPTGTNRNRRTVTKPPVESQETGLSKTRSVTAHRTKKPTIGRAESAVLPPHPALFDVMEGLLILRPRSAGMLLNVTCNPRLTFWREPHRSNLWTRLTAKFRDRKRINRILWLITMTADKASSNRALVRATLSHLLLSEWDQMGEEILKGGVR